MKESEVIDTQVGDVHVKDTQIADVNIGTYGSGDYVLSTGQQIRAELITNNTLRIFDGVMVYCGVRDAVAVDDYHDVTIENGSQGMNRNDIVVRYFKKDATTRYGTAEFKAIKGTPTSGTATDPEITVTDLRSGDIDHSMKLYRARLEGLNVVAVEPLFDVLMPMSELQAMLAELNSKLQNPSKTLLGSVSLSSANNTEIKLSDSILNYREITVIASNSEGLQTDKTMCANMFSLNQEYNLVLMYTTNYYCTANFKFSAVNKLVMTSAAHNGWTRGYLSVYGIK